MLSRLQAGPQRVRKLALATLWGIVLYVLVDLALNFLPPHCSLLSQPESDYAIGPYGFLMTFNFVLRGLFSLGLVAALYGGLGPQARSRVGLVLLLVWAVGAFLLAVLCASPARSVSPR